MRKYLATAVCSFKSLLQILVVKFLYQITNWVIINIFLLVVVLPNAFLNNLLEMRLYFTFLPYLRFNKLSNYKYFLPVVLIPNAFLDNLLEMRLYFTFIHYLRFNKLSNYKYFLLVVLIPNAFLDNLLEMRMH